MQRPHSKSNGQIHDAAHGAVYSSVLHHFPGYRNTSKRRQHGICISLRVPLLCDQVALVLWQDAMRLETNPLPLFVVATPQAKLIPFSFSKPEIGNGPCQPQLLHILWSLVREQTRNSSSDILFV